MKKNKSILAITLILILMASVLIYRTKSGTIKEALRDFAVSDTGSISKIFLANKNGNTVTLEKKDNFKWLVNGKYIARPDAVKTLLTTIKSISVRTRVAKAAYNTIVKDLSVNGIKCEIYQRGEAIPMKVYYIGGSTQDVLGTFMMLENSKLPFVMEIPGFQGYLTPRYTPNESAWRDIAAFDYKPDEIKAITIRYFHEPEKSFTIEKNGNLFKVFSPETNRAVQHVDTIGIVNYLSYFKYLCFEGWDAEFTDQQRDSLKITVPIATISVTDIKGQTTSITTFPKPVTSRSLAQADSAGNPLQYDIDRMYAFANEGKDFVTIQYYVFGKIMRQLDEFDLSKQIRDRKMKPK